MNKEEITELYLEMRSQATKIPSAIMVNGVTLSHRCLFLEGYYVWEEQRRKKPNRLHIIPDRVMETMIRICVPSHLPTNTLEEKIEAVIERVFFHNAQTWKNPELPIEATESIMIVEL